MFFLKLQKRKIFKKKIYKRLMNKGYNVFFDSLTVLILITLKQKKSYSFNQ